MIDIDKLLNLPKLNENDTFTFSCNRCGRCCRNRDDIILSPLDLFRIANFLNKQIPEVLEAYCEVYEGPQSKIPVVRIKPKIYQQTCPFVKKGNCIIHPVKPTICALYPLGRWTNHTTNEQHYFLQPTSCGGKKQIQTVKEWLSKFSISENKEIHAIWQSNIMQISQTLRELYEKYTFNHAPLNYNLLIALYIMYDLGADFLPQFKENCVKTLQIIKKLSDVIKAKEGDI